MKLLPSIYAHANVPPYWLIKTDILNDFGHIASMVHITRHYHVLILVNRVPNPYFLGMASFAPICVQYLAKVLLNSH